MKRTDWVAERIATIEELNQRRKTRLFGGLAGPRMELEGRDVVQFCGNDYLGLASHPDVISAGRDALSQAGAGSTGSRLITGTRDQHELLETKIADYKQKDAALTFPSGYQANLGVIPAIVGKGDWIFSDELNHASIIDGCRLSGAKVVVYEHANMEELDAKLNQVGRSGRKLIVTDGVFSMDGDLAPLDTIADIADDTGAMLYVDDAHGTGVVGPGGRGTAHHFGVQDRVDFQMGTFSKALGSQGGFVAANEEVIVYLKNKSRGFIFSTAPTPATTASCLAALEVARKSDNLRQQLFANVRRLVDTLAKPGFDLGPADSPILPLKLGEEERTMAVMAALEKEGIFVAGIRPPTVAPGTCRLRITMSALHTGEDIDLLAKALLRRIKRSWT